MAGPQDREERKREAGERRVRKGRAGSHPETAMIRTIPLNRLVPSPRNVRRSVDEQADLQLKADIQARGLLQNLVVTAAAKPRGRFAVEAGGRRKASSPRPTTSVAW